MGFSISTVLKADLDELIKSKQFKEEDHVRDTRGRFAKKSGGELGDLKKEARELVLKIAEKKQAPKTPATDPQELPKMIKNAENKIKGVINTEKEIIRSASRFKAERDLYSNRPKNIEAEKYIKENFGFDCSLEGFDPLVAEITTKALDRVKEKTPKLMDELKESLSFIGDSKAFLEKFKKEDIRNTEWSKKVREKMLKLVSFLNPKANRYVIEDHVDKYLYGDVVPQNENVIANTDANGIYLSKYFEDYDLVGEIIAEGVANNWQAKNNLSVQSIIEHEIGHQIQFIIEFGDDLNRKLKLRNFINENLINNGQNLVKNISKMATSTKSEFIAECYIEFLSDPKNKRGNPVVKKFKKMLKDVGYL